MDSKRSLDMRRLVDGLASGHVMPLYSPHIVAGVVLFKDQFILSNTFHLIRLIIMIHVTAYGKTETKLWHSW
jgi:hypothetical protein